MCLQEWMSALLNCLPAAQRARARLRMELGRMQARAKRMGLSQIALVASLAIMVRSCAASRCSPHPELSLRRSGGVWGTCSACQPAGPMPVNRLAQVGSPGGYMRGLYICLPLPHAGRYCAAYALQAIVAGVAVVKNAALSRAIRRKDQEMNQLILMVNP